MSAALVERSAVVVKRRKLLGRPLRRRVPASSASWPLFPLLRSLGPLPGPRSTSPTGARGRCWSTPTAGR